MAGKVYYQDRSRDILITDQMARLGSDAKVWWISELDRAVVQTLFRVRWDIVVWAVVGGLFCELCLLLGQESSLGALVVFVLSVVCGLVIAVVTANCYRVRLRTKRWWAEHALESSDRDEIKVVVDALNMAIEDYRRLYNLPPPRKDVPL